MTVIGAFVALCGVAAVHLLVPEFEDVFVSFGAELPALTRLFVHGRVALWALPLAVPIAAALIRDREPTDKRSGIVALLLGFAIAIGLPLICAFAMYLPIFRLAGAVE